VAEYSFGELFWQNDLNLPDRNHLGRVVVGVHPHEKWLM